MSIAAFFTRDRVVTGFYCSVCSNRIVDLSDGAAAWSVASRDQPSHCLVQHFHAKRCLTLFSRGIPPDQLTVVPLAEHLQQLVDNARPAG